MHCHARSIRVQRKTLSIHSKMTVRRGDGHGRVVDRRGAECLCLTDSQRIQAGRLLRVSFRIQERVPVCELERLQPIRKIEIVRVIIRRQDKVNLVLPCLIVNRPVAVGESVSEARMKIARLGFYMLKPLSGWATIVPVNEPLDSWANDPLLSAIALPIPPSVSPCTL